ncbi:MAG: class I SAM-dependent methyltransferase [Deltaproteobacteria bacterium]|nr:class I SAM-dependent methyltransferase [Deltaproteobacteria bacterium]
MNVTLASTRCALCGDVATDPVVVAPDPTGVVPGAFRVVRCRSCSGWRLDPAPVKDEIARLYPPDYEAHIRPITTNLAVIPGPTHRLRRRFADWCAAGRPSVWRMIADRAWDVLMARVFSHTTWGRYNLLAFWGDGRRLLDVGCGSGELLSEYHALGWSAFGIEPAGAAAARAIDSGLRVVTGRFSDDAHLLADHAPFSVIVMANVIEHLPDPGAALDAAWRLLEDGGRLLLWAPVCDGWQQRLWPAHWYNLDPPRHLHIPSRFGLRSLLRQHGFEVHAERPATSVRAVQRSAARYAASRGHVRLAARIESSTMLRRLLNVPLRLADAFDLGDVVTILAAKSARPGHPA